MMMMNKKDVVDVVCHMIKDLSLNYYQHYQYYQKKYFSHDFSMVLNDLLDVMMIIIMMMMDYIS